MSVRLVDLPDESFGQIAHCLSPPDVLSWLSTHPEFYKGMGMSQSFWHGLNQAHFPEPIKRTITPPTTAAETDPSPAATATVGGGDWKQAKENYLLRAHSNVLSHVRWYPAQTTPSAAVAAPEQEPSAREGHLCCQLGQHILLTGGFTDDEAVYAKDVTSNSSTWQILRLEATVPSANPGVVVNDGAEEEVEGQGLMWVYGATLTALDDRRAVRFGGFRAGGYTHETAQVAVLHFDSSAMTAWWEIITCRHFVDQAHIDSHNNRNHPISLADSLLRYTTRAYHTATLVFGRYMIVMGGISHFFTAGSRLNPIVLDCLDWVWYTRGIVLVGRDGAKPSPRHGCSVIDDVPDRGRLLLFGGGSGSDLLRSGEDNTEVWALDLSNTTPTTHWGSSFSIHPSSSLDDAVATKSNTSISTGSSSAADSLVRFRQSLPWKWKLLHADQNHQWREENNMDDDDDSEGVGNRLSPVEGLNLGRCHGCHRVSRDTALLLFGSGRPTTTNSVLGYNLRHDAFFRPQVCGPFLPRGRFTFASVFVPSRGCIVVHGGFSNQGSSAGSLSDTLVLDLAPRLLLASRQPGGLLWPVDETANSFPAVSMLDLDDVSEEIPEIIMGRYLSELMQFNESERPAAAGRMLRALDLEGSHNGVDERSAVFLQLVESGQAVLRDRVRNAFDEDD